ncbi:unnamed protein product [Paramecium pentaurelia]|uniref:FH2 domain-containing protein n=1 Tax=Paramecium pentaurelia TaxID=43138 RepID=A0A8S1SWR9_9CILI|nr:unnamed protein product [Paramecium pentaurelia]
MGNELQSSSNSTQYSYMFRGKQLNIKNINQPPKFQINVDNFEEIFDQILSDTNLEKKKFSNLNLKQKQLLLVLHYYALINENPLINNLNQDSDLLIYISFYQEIKALIGLNDELLTNQLIPYAFPIVQKQIEYLSLNRNTLNIYDKLYVMLQGNLLFLGKTLEQQQLITLTNNLSRIIKIPNSQILAQIYQQYEKISWRQINGYQLIESLMKKQSQEFCLLQTIQQLETSSDKKLIAAILSFINNFVELSNEKIQLKQLLLVHGVELIFQDIKKKLEDNLLVFQEDYSILVGIKENSNDLNNIIIKHISAFETLLESGEPNIRESINQFRISYNPKSQPINRVSVGNVQLAQVVFPEQFLLSLQHFSSDFNQQCGIHECMKKLQRFLSQAEVYGKNIITKILQIVAQNCLDEYNNQEIQIEDLKRQLNDFQTQKIVYQTQLKQTQSVLYKLKQALNMYQKRIDNQQSSDSVTQLQGLDETILLQKIDGSLQIHPSEQNKETPVLMSCSLPVQKSAPSVPPSLPPPPPPPPPPPQKTVQVQNKKDIRQRRKPTQQLICVGITEIKQMKSNIFQTLDDSKIELKFEELDKHFQKNQSKIAISLPSSSQIKIKQQQVLTLDRSRNIELILVKIKIKMDDMINYIKEMNYSKFTSDDIESLIQILPTIQEIQEFKKIENISVLNRPELFLYNLIQIENYYERIIVFQILLNQSQNEIQNELKLIEEQIQSIQSNVKLKKLLCYILAGINYLNSSSNKDSYGFKLSEFSKIAPIKSNNSSKINFLSLILRMAEQNEGELIGEEDFNLQQLKKLSKVSLINIKKQIEKQEQEKKLIIKYSDKIKVDNLELCQKQNLNELYSKVNQQFNDICEAFFEDPKKVDSDYFFTELSQMIENLIEQKKFIRIIDEETQRKKAIDQINSYVQQTELKKNLKDQDIGENNGEVENSVIKQIEERKSYKQQVQEMRFRSLKSLAKIKKNIKQQREQQQQ